MSRTIAVIGAGIAGASIAHALVQRGHQVIALETAAQPATGASGNRAGVFRPLPSLDDSRLSRLLRAGFLRGRELYAGLEGARCGWTGVLHLARDPKHEDTQRRIAVALAPTFCHFVERDAACALAGWPVDIGGWWFPQGGWLDPASLCRALLANIDCRFACPVTRLERTSCGWRIDECIEVDDVVLANGIAAPALIPDLQLPIRIGRGTVSHIPADATPACDIVVTRLGYVTPIVDGLRCAGATTASGDRDPIPRLADHIENLQRLEMALPGFGSRLDPAALDGRTSFRPMSPDRLPIVGPLSANEGLWIINGFGARGLVFAPICAELLAAQISGGPLPLADDLVAAVAPVRFSKTRQTTQARA